MKLVIGNDHVAVALTRAVKPAIKVCSAGNDANLFGALLCYQAQGRQ